MVTALAVPTFLSAMLPLLTLPRLTLTSSAPKMPLTVPPAALTATVVEPS